MRKMLLSIALVLGVMVGAAQPVMAVGDICSDPDRADKFSPEVLEAAGCNIDKDYKISDPIQGILNVVLGIVGVIAVGVIIYGGILYMKSAGDAAKTTQGRRALVGGIVGLLISLLAFAIVNFVIQGIQ